MEASSQNRERKTEKVAKSPGRWHYMIGIAVWIVGFVLFAIFLFTQINGGSGETMVSLLEPSLPQCFHKYPTVHVKYGHDE